MNDTTQPVPRASGRWLLGVGFGLTVIGVAIVFAPLFLKKTIAPWWASPGLATLSAGMILAAVWRRPGIVRIGSLVLIGAFAALQWFFFGVMLRLPDYSGPVSDGRLFPDFRSCQADGRPFTVQDLKDGRPTVMVLFRGRW